MDGWMDAVSRPWPWASTHWWGQARQGFLPLIHLLNVYFYKSSTFRGVQETQWVHVVKSLMKNLHHLMVTFLWLILAQQEHDHDWALFKIPANKFPSSFCTTSSFFFSSSSSSCSCRAAAPLFALTEANIDPDHCSLTFILMFLYQFTEPQQNSQNRTLWSPWRPGCAACSDKPVAHWGGQRLEVESRSAIQSP